MVAGIGQLMSGDVPYPTIASLVQEQRCHNHGWLAPSLRLLIGGGACGQPVSLCRTWRHDEIQQRT